MTAAEVTSAAMVNFASLRVRIRKLGCGIMCISLARENQVEPPPFSANVYAPSVTVLALWSQADFEAGSRIHTRL
jgi:hypothetical protein